MAELRWSVEFTGQAVKPHKYLSASALEAFWKLVQDLKNGPEVPGWKNYSQIHTQSYHCHLKKGKPTYVVFWRADKKARIIEIYYAGTHEKAPY